MKHIVFFLILSMVLVGCEDKDPPSLIVVTTGEATNITFESAKINVDLSDTKGVKEIGVVYSTDKDFATSQTVKVEESLFTKGGFNLVNLLSQTTYYYKGFAADGLKNMVYGKVKKFITKESTLSVSPSQINADYKEGEYQFQITTESEWTVTSNQTWCTVDKTSGKGETTITIHVTENVDFEERNAVISIKVNDITKKEVKIVQALQSTSLEVSQLLYMAEESGGNYELSVQCNKIWDVTSDQNWCNVVPDFENSVVHIQLPINNSLVRSATITVSSGQDEKKILLNQAGIEYIDITSSLILSKLALSLRSEGDECQFAISCAYDWNVTSDQTWCTILTSSEKGQGIVNLRVDANPYAFTRFATVTVRSKEYSQNLVIVQHGKGAYSTIFAKTFTELLNYQNFWLNEFAGVTFSSNREWCSFFKYDELVQMKLENNSSIKPRCALISLKKKDENIVQALVVQYGTIPQQVNYLPAIEMVYVEGGEFIMGGEIDDEIPKHKVTLDDYYIGKYEVSQAQWKAIMGTNPSEHIGDNLPVENIRWNKAQEFITKLNELSGESYRLPTEAEWEYAAKGGNKSKGYKYSGSNSWKDVGWSVNYTTNFIGSLKPNELGIYNMSGNVNEWCSDWYGPYTKEEQYNPQGPISGKDHVVRGVTNVSRSWGLTVGQGGFRLVKDVKK